MTSAEYKEQLSAALRKIGGMLPLGFEYTRLTGQNAPLGGVDYMGQTATRAMYADLWAWLNEHKPDAIVTESEWQNLYASQNGNVAKFSNGDGSTTFRFPRVMGYFKGADAISSLGEYTNEGLPDITGAFTLINHNPDYHTYAGAFDKATVSGFPVSGMTDGSSWKEGWGTVREQFKASSSNPIFGASNHVTPETVTIVMGVIAFGSVASIGEATEEGIVAELSEHSSKLDELGSQVDELEGSVANAIPAGFVMPFAANSDPEGYLLCNGAAVSRTTYAALFSAIGTTYGSGDGSTTFNLPNLTDKFIQGSGTAGTVKAAGLPNILGTFARRDNAGLSGAFYEPGVAVSGYHEHRASREAQRIQFDASRSNSIYGASTTVQPPALTMRYYIKY